MFRASPKFMEKLEAQSKSKSTLPPDQRAFLDAAWAGDTEKVRESLAKGVPADLREDFCRHYLANEQTALMYAAAEGHLEIVRLLLKAGASVSAVDKNMAGEDEGAQTPLHYAVRQKDIAVVEELLRAGADVNALTNRRKTPLHHALWHGNGEAARLLVSRGANLTSRIERKQLYSALVAAIDALRNDISPETVRDFFLFLLDAGADPNAVGGANQTALFALLAQDKLPEDMLAPLLEKLLKAGAKPDWLDKFGMSPLLYAMLGQHAKAVELLLEAGADVNRIATRGTALDINMEDLKWCEKDFRELNESPPPADEKTADRQKRFRAALEDKHRRCKEIGETLRKFRAKRKSQLPKEE